MLKVYHQNINSLRVALILVFLLCFLNSCEDDPFTKVTKQVPVVNLLDPYQELPNYQFTVSSATLKGIYVANGINDPELYIKNAVSYHRIVYTTVYKGEEITVSGAMIIPIKPEHTPSIVSFQHGTMFADSSAPSNAETANEIVPIFNEYIVFMPDYIGYGESVDIVHPYYLYEPTVRSVIDMIKAGKKYLDDSNIEYDPRFFLTGHSEGGYVTVATQKELEATPVDGLDLVASAPSAGPYDMEETGNIIFGNDTYISPAYLILVLTAYNIGYWERPLTDYFQNLYASRINQLLGGSYNEDEINQRLTSDLTKLMNPVFLENFRNDGEEAFKNALKDNSVYNWKPEIPTRLYHGTNDPIVPYEIAQKTYESFISNGSDPSKIKLVPLQGVGHDFFSSYKLILEWFDSLK